MKQENGSAQSLMMRLFRWALKHTWSSQNLLNGSKKNGFLSHIPLSHLPSLLTAFEIMTLASSPGVMDGLLKLEKAPLSKLPDLIRGTYFIDLDYCCKIDTLSALFSSTNAELPKHLKPEHNIIAAATSVGNRGWLRAWRNHTYCYVKFYCCYAT